MKKEWEHIPLSSFKIDELISQMNEHGKQGWECAGLCFMQVGFRPTFLGVMKREKKIISQLPPTDEQPTSHHKYEAGAGKPPVVTDDEKNWLDQVH